MVSVPRVTRPPVMGDNVSGVRAEDVEHVLLVRSVSGVDSNDLTRISD